MLVPCLSFPVMGQSNFLGPLLSTGHLAAGVGGLGTRKWK